MTTATPGLYSLTFTGSGDGETVPAQGVDNAVVFTSANYYFTTPAVTDNLDRASLMPRSSSFLEFAIEESIAVRQTDGFPELWNPDTCPERFLVFLAQSLSVDNWDSSWTTDTKRAVIKASIAVHRSKGTVGAIKRALKAAGYGEVTITEGYGGLTYDGAENHDDTQAYGQVYQWSEYNLYMSRPITLAQADTLRAILESVAPARCELRNFFFNEVPNTHDETLTYNGASTYGDI